MPIVYLTRRAVFAASHRLHAPELAEEENLRLFGKCNNSHGHGHNYTIEVTIRGETDPRTGLLINLTDLKGIIHEEVSEPLDHKHLNLDVPDFEELNPTAENIAVVCWKRLHKRLGDLLYEVVIRETENNFAVYRGE